VGFIYNKIRVIYAQIVTNWVDENERFVPGQVYPQQHLGIMYGHTPHNPLSDNINVESAIDSLPFRHKFLMNHKTKLFGP
jgi:hypothetical protein